MSKTSVWVPGPGTEQPPRAVCELYDQDGGRWTRDNHHGTSVGTRGRAWSLAGTTYALDWFSPAMGSVGPLRAIAENRR